ncbi:MAG: acetyl-CoA C-acetyltransferase [Planctomycetota bacterium]
MSEAFIISGARTPIGSYLGSYAKMSATDLGGIVVKSAIERSKLDPEKIEEVIMGNVVSTGIGQAPARQAALKAGLPSTIAAVTINKVCGSGLKAVMLASQAIRCGDASAIVAGGMENMSAVPHFAKGLRGGLKLGDTTLVDGMVFDGLTCSFENCHMGLHAEHVAEKYGVSREDQDAFASESQKRAAHAIQSKAFEKEIVPVTIKTRKGETTVAVDEGVRPDTTPEGLAGLRPVFDKSGTVTAGNASTLSDGAAAVVVADAKTASQADWKFKIVASHTSGVDPKEIFIAPVDAIKGVFEKSGWTKDDIDLFEINEAFASQMVACVRGLDLDMSKVNINGGGISLGHPIGASGTRVLVTLIHAMLKNNLSKGIASLCLGGGNAVAMAIEKA